MNYIVRHFDTVSKTNGFQSLTRDLIAALQRPRRFDAKPDWAPMQQLFDAGLSHGARTSVVVAPEEVFARRVF